jgi:hypothetical protein
MTKIETAHATSCARKRVPAVQPIPAWIRDSILMNFSNAIHSVELPLDRGSV